MSVTFDYYISDYYGEAIEDALTFERYQRKALNYIHSYTFNRLKKEHVFCEEINTCICELVDYLFENDNLKALSQGVASESTDGHSVTYEKKEVSQTNNEVKGIIRRNLLHTNLLYPGENKYVRL